MLPNKCFLWLLCTQNFVVSNAGSSLSALLGFCYPVCQSHNKIIWKKLFRVITFIYLGLSTKKKKKERGGKRNNSNNSFGACYCPHFSLLKYQFGVFNSPLLDCFKKLELLTKDKECNLMEVKSAYSVNLGFIIPVTRLATVLKPF